MTRATMSSHRDESAVFMLRAAPWNVSRCVLCGEPFGDIMSLLRHEQEGHDLSDYVLLGNNEWTS